MKSTNIPEAAKGRQRESVLSVILFAVLCLAAGLLLAGCGKKADVHAADSETGPHPAVVEPDMDANNF